MARPRSHPDPLFREEYSEVPAYDLLLRLADQLTPARGQATCRLSRTTRAPQCR